MLNPKEEKEKITRWESSSEIIVNPSSVHLSEDVRFYSEVDEMTSDDVLYVEADDISEKLERVTSKNRLTVIRGVAEHGSTIPTITKTENIIMCSLLSVDQLSENSLTNSVIIDYSLSEQGIVESLLNLILAKECYHVQNKTASLSSSQLKRSLNIQDCEITLLQYIVNYPHCLLASKELIPLVSSTVDTIHNENIALADCELKSSQLTEKAEQYKPLALHGAVISKVLLKLSKLSPFYNFYLGYVTKALSYILDHVAISSGISARVKELKTLLHVAIYDELALICHPDHVFIYPLLLVLQGLLSSKQISQQEYLLFLDTSTTQYPYTPADAPHWCSVAEWQSLDKLEILSVFSGIKQHIQANDLIWSEYLTMKPVLLQPSPWEEQQTLTLYHRALIWCYARPSGLMKVCEDLVQYCLPGEMAPAPPSLPDARATVLLCKNQEDVLLEIQYNGEECGASVKVLHMTSESCKLEAEKVLLQAATYGYWVVMLQCEAVTAWGTDLLRTLFMLINTLNQPQLALPNKVHYQFRLLLVTSLEQSLTLPPVLVEGFTVRTYCPNSSRSQAPQLYKSPSLQKALICLHNYLIETCDGVWTSDDLFTTIELLNLASRDVDLLDCARSVVGMMTYGARNTTQAQSSLLHNGIEEYLSTVNEESLHISSLKSLPDIPKPHKQTKIRSTLHKLSSVTQDVSMVTQDVTMVTEHLNSVLPLPPTSSNTDTALSRYLADQADHYTALLNRITTSLGTVQDVLEGNKTSNQHANSVIQYLTRNEVPSQWDVSSLSLAHWVHNLCERVECLKKMLGSGRNVSEMSGRQSSTISNMSHSVDIDNSITYSLPIFTSPKDFILSYMYDWCNCNNVTLGDVMLRVTVTSLVSAGSPDNGLYIDGLVLCQGGWDSKRGMMYPASTAQPLPPLLLQVNKVFK